MSKNQNRPSPWGNSSHLDQESRYTFAGVSSQHISNPTLSSQHPVNTPDNPSMRQDPNPPTSTTSTFFSFVRKRPS